MSLIGQVGRRQWRSRVAMTFMYLLLATGAITTLYPFAAMVSTGFKGPTDQNDNAIVPAFWTNSADLKAKYIEDKYSGNKNAISSSRIGIHASNALIAKYQAFLEDLPLDWFSVGFRTGSGQVTSRLAVRYQDWLRERYSNIEAVNKAYIEESTAFQTVTPPNEQLERKLWSPPEGRKYQQWLEFKATLPAEYRIPVRSVRTFQEWLRAKSQSQFSSLPPEVRGGAKTFEELNPDENSAIWKQFKSQGLQDRFRAETIESRWRTISDQTMPIDAYESEVVKKRFGEISREFTTRNYRYVLDYIILHGRALCNTAVFCVLMILIQLTVNPIAAYALSRYPVKASLKILLFLLATMAFPAEVAMIPSFLMLKGLGLLNTYAALVLPAAASGYMIFLLKGFFDSLPQELFESGQIDGASETTMLLKIAYPLTKPVLGYMALLAFMGAYGSFLYAMLVVQDQKMWTLMVFIYQLQSVAPKSVMMAALTVAAIPTLIVFLLAQRTILKGIVLPGEK